MFALQNNQNLTQLDCTEGSIMVGIMFNEGVLMAVTMTSHLIYYLDDRIYCSGRNTGYDREALLEVATELEDTASHASGCKGALVAQVLELLTKRYENLQDAELLLAGEDVCGLHLFTITCEGYEGVCYAALGTGAALALDYISSRWKEDLTLKEAETIARRAIQRSKGAVAKVDICIIFQRH